ncbi:hypothetical protein SARC_08873 [Sphaeroforma arctica JP610]|uniref:Armadillo repeat-containing domain-containing protein n=1 Tax=Sphaeroforma arctica JP610 TaxID=667725 RepID=A0A0L0FQ96_9EUKA|nr:hypothetical protein SARC_08873 [Sphaeroforma arctica JP610]KNC78701.1 hypothetical protein SARC_08873 [Sphaeroforma arctica JP610]|eukprot:XP_014152603.1 hypothetical protein SARC_08873 [Sphaeroforma arctica JP610]
MHVSVYLHTNTLSPVNTNEFRIFSHLSISQANQIKLKQEALTAELRPILTCIDANDNDRLKLLASLEKVRRLATKHISSASLRTVFIKEDVHTQASELLKKKQDQPEVASAAMGVLAVVLKPSAKGAPPRDDVGQAAIQLILDNQDNRDVLINGLRLIVTVCIIQEAHESLFENDEIFKVLDLAFESKDRTAQEEACRTIQKVCSTASADTRGILLDHGYHVRVLLMLRELESPEALECALGALANLAHKNERNAELIDVGAIDGIHTIVNDNFDEQGVVMRGVGALLNLAVFGMTYNM